MSNRLNHFYCTTEGMDPSDVENTASSMPNRKARRAWHSDHWAKVEHYVRDNQCRAERRAAAFDNLAEMHVETPRFERWEYLSEDCR